MPLCSICGELSDKVTRCKQCGERFCENCGDPEEKLCYYCDDEEDEDWDVDDEDYGKVSKLKFSNLP
jgi:hypothetical protein